MNELCPDALNQEDISLMAAIAGGDKKAFTLLIQKHQKGVLGTISKMLNDKDEAQDLAQQVFLRLWKAAPSYEPQAKFTTWLYTITRNIVFNETRRLKRASLYSYEQAQEEYGWDIADEDNPSPDEELQQKELQKAVDAAIEALPEKARLAVILRRYENMPYEEIAVVLELSVSAVKSLLFRARAQLKESLSVYLSEDA